MTIRLIGDAYYSYANQLAADTDADLSRQYTQQYLSDPEVAAQITANMKRYNYLTPGAALALGQAKQGPDTPAAQEVARTVAKRKASSGLGWHSFGDFLGAVVPPVGHLIGYLAEPTAIAARGIVRYGTAGLSSVTNLMNQLYATTARDIHDQGVLPGLYSGLVSNNDIHAGETPLGESLLHGKSLGSGYFTGSSPAHLAADEALRNTYEIDGYAPTLGRIIDNTINEPGYIPHWLLSGAVDLFAATKLDPGNRALVGYSKLRKAAKGFEEAAPLVTPGQRIAQALASPEERAAAGLVDTARRVTVDDNAALSWATNIRAGNRFIQDATSLTSPYEILKKYPNMDLDTARRLSETRTDSETLYVFSDRYLSGMLAEKPNAKLGLNIRDNPDRSIRLMGTIPRDNIAHMNDLDQTAHLLEAHLANARMSGSAIGTHIDKLAYATTPGEWRATLDAALQDASLRAAGVVDDTGRVTSTGKALRLGEKVYLSDSPHIGEVVNIRDIPTTVAEKDLNKVANTFTYNQKFATVRTITDGIPSHVEVPVESLSVHAPISALRPIFKGAYRTAAEVADEMVDEVASATPRSSLLIDSRMADLSTAHPWAEFGSETYTMPNIREIRRVTSAYGRLLNSSPLGILPDAGDLFNKVWRPIRLMSFASGLRAFAEDQMRLAVDGGTSLLNHPIRTINIIFGRSGDHANLLQSADEMQTVLAHSGGGWLDRSVSSFSRLVHAHQPDFPRALADRVVQLARDPLAQKLASSSLDEAKLWHWEEEVPRVKALFHDDARLPGYLKSQAASDKHVEDMLTHLRAATAGDSKLLEAIAAGTIDGNPAHISHAGGFSPTDELLSHIRSRAGSPDFPPNVSMPRDPTPLSKNRAKRTVDSIFETLYSKPFKTITASPAVKDWYWQRAAQIFPMMSRDAQEEALNFARDANMPRAYLRGLAHSMLESSGDLAFHEAHTASKIYAVNKAKDLFYDLHDKSQFGDIVRHFSPFFDVWRDSIKSWAKLTARNPAIINKFQLGVAGARGSGFFHVDPQTGDEVFSYPGAEFVSKHLTNGIPVPLVGSVKSLNLALSGTTPLLPSVGPIVQFALSAILPNKPDTQWLRDYAMPYGDPTLGGQLTPSWVGPILTALSLNPLSDRQYASAVKDAQRSLMGTGEYDPSDQKSMRALEDKANKMAKTIFFYRGISSLFSPAAPRPEWKAQDPDGKWLAQKKMADILHQFENDPKIGYDNAAVAFLKLFGMNNFLMLQPNTSGYSPDNKATYDWMRENPDLAEQYPDAFQYFAPRSSEKAPYAAYTAALQSGTRRELTNQEWHQRANDRVASMIYYNAKDIIGPKPAPNQTDWLRGLKTFLSQKYPGFDPEAVDPKKRQRTIEQLYQAAQDPKVLSSTDAGKGIAIYLSARDAAIQSAASGKIIGWQTAKSTRNIRDWLRQVAANITAQHPDFERVWSKVFEGEMPNE